MRTVSFRYDGWAYQMYRRSLKERGVEEPARVSRCDVLGGVLWMATSVFWKKSLGKEVPQASYVPVWGVAILAVCLAYIVGFVVFVAYAIVQAIPKYGALATVTNALAIVGFVALGLAVIIGVIAALYKARFFRDIVAAYRLCRESVHFLHELAHHAAEGSVLCPIVEVTGRPQQVQAE